MAVSLNRPNGTLAFIYWIWDGLDRTIFTAIKFSFPARFVSPFGFHIRNIHYHGSNAMVMLALLHMYYQYFSGRYKIRNEILWVTGVILGTVTILEAFTGYDIIFSERAELAISIAASLTNAIPIAGPTIRDAAFGSGFSDFVLRFYTCLLYTSPSPRDRQKSRMPSSA